MSTYVHRLASASGFYHVFGENGPLNTFSPKIPAPPLGAPTTDTAYNAQVQADQLRNMQRGVLANIYAGNNAAPPTTGSRTLLGG